MACVAGDEDTRIALVAFGFGYVVEVVCQTLPDFTDRPVSDFSYVEGVWREDLLRSVDDNFCGDVLRGDPLVLLQFVHFDVESCQIPAFSRNDEDTAVLRRMNRRLESDVREISHDESVQHTPSLVCEITLHLNPNRLPHSTPRAVTAHNILRLDMLPLPCICSIRPLNRNIHRFISLWQRHLDHLSAIRRLQPRGRPLHAVQPKIMQPCLVQDDVWKLAQALFCIPYSSASSQALAILSRRPECSLPHQVSLQSPQPSQKRYVPTSLTQYASFNTLSLNPNASKISIVRHCNPSACPCSNLPCFDSMILVFISGNRAICAPRSCPAGPAPTIRTSTSSGRDVWKSGSVPWNWVTRESPELWKPLVWNCMVRERERYRSCGEGRER